MRVRVRDCSQRNCSAEETCYPTAKTRRHCVRNSSAAHPHSPACRIHDRIYRTGTPVVPGAGCCFDLEACTYRVRQKSSHREFFSVFAGLAWNFKTKFYTLM